VSTTIQVDVTPSYAVHVGRGCLAAVRGVVSERSPSAVLTDGRVAGLHAERLAGFGDAPWIQVPRGEEAKRFEVLERVLGEMADAGLDRSSVLVTLGGGAVCDLGGLAASLYARGIDVVHCPTTLLAQVDAAVGGKTAVNLGAGKNLAGTFHQPRAVFADTGTLTTLDTDELRAGFGEVVKSALLGAEGLPAQLEGSAFDLETVVAACVRLKAQVVAVDEREAGARKQLNLGHTFAHAIEHVAGYGSIPHGVAVAVGLVLALEASRRTRLLEDPRLPERTAAWLRALELPTSLADLRRTAESELPPDALTHAMRGDKKGRRSEPRFVLPRALGVVELDVPLEPALVTEILE
jgi:3-dehydroquinate synthase